jgi:hypothetical protein
MPTRDLRVSISNPAATDSGDDGSVVLQIEDAASGVVLADLTIPPGRWWRLCLGSTQTHEGFVGPDLHRVGARRVTRMHPVPREVYRQAPAEEQGESVRGWAAERFNRGPLSDYSVRRTNRGWEVIERHWEPEASGEAAAP